MGFTAESLKFALAGTNTPALKASGLDGTHLMAPPVTVFGQRNAGLVAGMQSFADISLSPVAPDTGANVGLTPQIRPIL